MTTPTSGAGSVARFRAKGRRCPICKRPTTIEIRPFCSKRCSQIDLGRWFSEVYKAPADDDEAAESEIWSETAQRANDSDI